MRSLFHASTIAVAACIAAPAYAQETTSSIRGTVTSEAGPVANAEVVITHVPSGTVSTTSSGADGSFSASGLRVGGPFSVHVVAQGYAETTVTGIELTAGQPLRLPVELATTGGDIVVTARRSGAVELSPGPITSLNRSDIEGVASVSRDIRDIVRRDPFATIDPGQSRGVMIAGQNARLNKFSVDGLRFSDNFGLNVGGLPTARGPVPIDAIEQLSVKIAPYDISEGDFQGGAINLVLRSGTNDFHGSAFYTYSSDKLTGDQTRPGIANTTGKINLDFTSKNWGAFLSGPIIKDKLFLALSYERLEEGSPISIGLAGFPNVVPNLSQAQIDQINSIAQSVYTYAAGGAQSSTLETDTKYTVKLDWNVTDGQRLSLTYINNDSANASTAGFSSTTAASPALGLESNNYRRPEKVESVVAQLNSDWSDKFHTEIRANYRNYDLTPVPFGEFGFGQFQVCLDPTATTQQNGAANASAIACSQGSTAAPGAARLYFGPDRFRHFNFVRTKQYGADVALRWEYGDFSNKLTAAWSHLDVANAFASDALGTYYFDSVADLQNRRASTVTLAGSITGDLNNVLASFQYDQYTFGLQTAWDPSPTFNLTVGGRIDLYGGITPPPLNQAFLGRYGFSNNHVINGKSVAQPRLSATWSPTEELRIRGGIGLFAGGSPDVFLGNSYSVAGVYGNSISINRNANGTCTLPTPTICSAALDNVNGRTFSSVITDYLRNNTGSLSLANVNAMDPDYALESTWKATVSVDYSPDLGFLGTGWNFGTDLYYGWVNNAPIYYDLRLRQIGTTPDGRPRYASTTTGGNTDLFLTNTHRGHSLVAVARVDKSFDWGLSLGASYSFQDVTDVSSMNGTTASGTYGQNAMVDPNIAAYGRSIYEIRNSWKFNVDFDHAFFGDYKTRFALFGELRSGIPYSLTMNDPNLPNSHSSVFGTAGSSNRYLLYVPQAGTDPIVTYDSAATQTALENFIAANGLEGYRGRILPKNTQRAPNWFKVDLHAEQELPLPGIDSLFSGARFKLFADVENFLNLINKDWGSLRQVAFPYLTSVVNVACVSATVNGVTNPCAQYRYSNVSNPAVDVQGRPSLWALRIGAKVQF
ncbi:MAG: carboxypeptidase regulatory-like domain-containing protein [Sphingomonas sp.]|uniref:TonB-dependent receptor n=1 Tax=Sphingomonas sp. TaxID=28214 RepID=UPI0022767AAF|nr:carboxypeptidase regulatory-like domain-containing protein [Sphingomonas sp.]MCX8475755.1 carboxypeptidase regulatory-like domain-containing protein [Sphingomonas sp.]